MTAAASPTNSVRLSQRIRASQERLFRAWTNPEELVHWWRMEGDGWAFAGADVDLVVGGKYRLAMTDPDGTLHAAYGVYREIDRPTRLAFTWEWENKASKLGDTLVTVEFRKIDDELTEVVLTHEGFADAARMAGHDKGWAQLLRLLDRAAEAKQI
jgi:uncharacterized protein YndB with AHSA1/START domain